MRLNGVRVGDIVQCDVKGRRFHAEVTAVPGEGELQVRPLTPAVTYRHVSARQVMEHWRKTGRPPADTSATPAATPTTGAPAQTLF